MAAQEVTGEDWAGVTNDADDETARLILKLQLDDIEEVEADVGERMGDGDEQLAFQLYKAELQYHQALRSADSDCESSDPTVQPEPPSATVANFACVVCGDRFDADHCWQAPCSHWYCDVDLADLFRLSLTDRTLYPPRCCRQTMPFVDVEHFLPGDRARAFAAKREELDEKLPTYCHRSACSAYIGAARKQGTTASCPRCAARTCVLCKQGEHGGDCVDDETVRQTEELAEREGWQRCPDCRRWVELTVGCNHITCMCRANFCFVCGARWKTCACPQSDEDRLYARGRQVAEREGRRDVAAVADMLREGHDCDGGHVWQRVDDGGMCDQCGDHLRLYIFRCADCRTQACRRCRDNRL